MKGVAVAAYATFDFLFFLAVIGPLTALFNPPVALLCLLAFAIIVNIGACNYVDGHWETWIATRGGHRVESQLTKLRSSTKMQRPVHWITSSSAGGFALASFLINPVVVVGIARVVGGEPVGPLRIRRASIAYASIVTLIISIPFVVLHVMLDR